MKNMEYARGGTLSPVRDCLQFSPLILSEFKRIN